MKLKHLLIPLASALLAASAPAGTSGKAPAAPAPEPEGLFDKVGATATIGYDTHYIFRGVKFAEHLVSGNIDLLIPVNDLFSVDFNAWYGSSAGDHAAAFAGGGSYQELDLTAAVYCKLDPVTIGLKYTWYDYLGNAGDFVEDINELGLTLATSAWGFDFGAGGYYDWTAEGWYFEYFVSRTFKITDWLSLVPGALISHASNYYGVDGGNNVKLSLAAPIKLSKTATLTPYIAASLVMDSLHHDVGEENQLYGGVALSITF